MIFILDAGHGNDTPGKRSPIWSDGSQLFEYEYNREIVKYIAEGLECLQIPFKILVPEIHDISLPERVERIHKTPGRNKILISVHGNAAGVPEASGFEVFTSKGTTRSDKIATVFIEELEREFTQHKHRKDYSDGDPDKESQFYILRKTRCPAILTENGFFTNPQECASMFSTAFRKRVAQSHINAIFRVYHKIGYK